MYKISIVGIDATGKTSIVDSLDGIPGIATIYLTAYKNNSSVVARFSGGLVNRLAKFGENRDSRFITGFAYLMHLFPCRCEERIKKSYPLLVSDRDPIVDTLCYSEFYLPSKMLRVVRPSLKCFLEHSFKYPNSFIYLNATPEESASRNHYGNQLHEKIGPLTKLKDLFDKQMFFLEHEGIPVNRIDTNSKSLDEVTDEIKFHISRV